MFVRQGLPARPRRRARKVIYAAVAMLGVVAVLASPAGAQGPAPTDGATLVVEPSTDLVGGTRAAVTGTGFTPNASILLTQCLPSAVVVDDCDVFGGFGSSFTDEAGAFSATYVVRPTISAPNAADFSCADSAEPCVVLAADTSAGVRARSTVSFDPDGVVPPLGELTATPNSGLADRQQVLLDLTLARGDLIDFFPAVRQCQADTACSEPQLNTTFHSADDIAVRVRRFLSGGFDCASAAGACVLEARDNVTEQRAAAPLTFDPSIPAVRVAAAVAPTANLPWIAPVTVTGSNWTQNEGVSIGLCVATNDGTPPQVCASIDSVFIESEAGSFSEAVTLRREFRSFFDGETYDCATGLGCVVVVRANHDSRDQVSVPVSFDADSERPPPPTLSIDPADDLPFVANVTATVASTISDTSGAFFQCPASAAGTQAIANSEEFYFQCRYLSDASSADGDLRVSQAVTLVRAFTPGGYFGIDAESVEPIDCAVVAGGCVVAFQFYDFDGSRVLAAPVSFDPDAVAPPSASSTASPTSGLADLDPVTVTGTNYRPNSVVQVSQCQRGGCWNRESTETDEQGSFTATFSVRRVIDTYGGPADCVGGFACELQVSGQGVADRQQTSIPLAFDPAIPGIPRTISAVPNTGLVDGDDITVSASGFTPGSRLNVSQCADRQNRNCIRLSNFDATADAAGQLIITVAAQRDFYGELDAIDCATTECVLAVSGSDQFSSITTDPIVLAYDSSVPFEPVTFVVSPNVDLVDGQRVGVTATRWPTDGCCGGDGGGHGGPLVEAAVAEQPIALRDGVSDQSLSVEQDLSFEEVQGNVSFGQCAVVDGRRAECFYGHQEPVEADGTFVSRAFARRFIGDYDCLEVECRLLVETISTQTGQRFVASSVMRYDPGDLSIIPGLIFVDEGKTATPVQVPVRLSRALDQEITVDYRLVGFGAEPGADFAQASGTVTFAAGRTEAMVGIQVYDDGAGENTEAVLISLTDPSIGEIGGFGFGALVILDNDSGLAE